MTSDFDVTITCDSVIAASNTPDDTRTADAPPPDVVCAGFKVDRRRPPPPAAALSAGSWCFELARSLARQRGAKRRRRRAMASSGAKGPRISASTANEGDDDDDDDEKEADLNGGAAPETESRGGMADGVTPGAEFARAASRSSQ